MADVLENRVNDMGEERLNPTFSKLRKVDSATINNSLEELVNQNQMEEVILPKDGENPIAQKGMQISPDVLDGLVEQSQMQEVIISREHDEERLSEAENRDADENGEPNAVKENQLAKSPSQTANALAGQPNIPLEPLRVLEAALFLANKPLTFRQMQDILQLPQTRVRELLTQLSGDIAPDSAVHLHVTEHAASLQLKPQYLERVAHLSKEVELSRKAMRILALVAKKKQMLQSDLKHFFKGEIYAYVTELKLSGYLDSKKQGNTRLLKPSSRFFESFDLKEIKN